MCVRTEEIEMTDETWDDDDDDEGELPTDPAPGEMLLDRREWLLDRLVVVPAEHRAAIAEELIVCHRDYLEVMKFEPLRRWRGRR